MAGLKLGYKKFLSSSLPLIVVLSGIIFISTLPDPPHPDDVSEYIGGIPLNDKVGHLIMFFGLGFLISNFLMNLFDYKGLKNLMTSTGLAFGVGVIHEINQYLVGRGYEIGDLAFDLIGGFLGATAWHVVVRIKSRLSKKTAQKNS